MSRDPHPQPSESAPSTSDKPQRIGMLTRLARWSDRQLLKSVPEYHLFESEESRLKAIKELDQTLEDSREFWRGALLIFVIATVLANLSFCAVPVFVPWRIAWLPFDVGWIVAGLIGVAAIGAVVWLWRRGVARRLRGKVIESGVPLCRACGYLMRGLNVAPTPAIHSSSQPQTPLEEAPVRCPECGCEADEAVRALIDRPAATR